VAQIREYRPSDRADIDDICLRTGDGGADATGLHVSDRLLSDIYALPYVDLEPELARVVDTGERVSGYVLGVADTRAFVERYRKDWLPYFAKTYPLVDPPVTDDDRLIETGHHPERMIIDELDDYPAHLHIDLLPELQGQGFGRKLIRELLAALRERGVPGVHLGVAERNTSARAFYERLGFRPLRDGNVSLLGISTGAKV
jgi:ribosomal protein S18 acetylase RimI-like enzyme